MRIVAMAGSLRAGSFNRQLLEVAARHAPAGAVVEIWEGLAEIPPYSEDIDTEDGPAPVTALRATLAAADAVLIATPEYNGSVPGQLKNALDWASRPFPDSALRDKPVVDWASRPFPDSALRDKPVAVIGASVSPGGTRSAQAELRKVLARIGADPLERTVPVASAWSAFDAEGQLTDEPALRELRVLLAELHDQTQPTIEPAAS